jgi:hypothetical protein
VYFAMFSRSSDRFLRRCDFLRCTYSKLEGTIPRGCLFLLLGNKTFFWFGLIVRSFGFYLWLQSLIL